MKHKVKALAKRLEVQAVFKKIGFSSDSRTIGGVGLIKSFADGVATVMLNDAAVGNKVKFTNWTNPNDFVFGCVKSFNADLAKTIIFADNSRVCAGDLVSIVGDTISIKSGEFEGTHVDTLGVVMPRDDIDTNFGFIYENSFEMAIDIKAPGIIDRAPVDEPLETGILVIDSLIPVGRGQRELIIGDRVTGKSSIAYDTMLTAKYGFLNNFFDSEVTKSDLLLSPNFRDYETCGVFCVYTCSGGRMNLLSCLMDLLEEHNSDSYSLIVSATASCPSILVYMSAFSGMTIAERYMNRGMDSLVVLDDLTKQAEAFRCVSLLMRLPPGRDAYPGDVFYLHSRLLERSAKLSKHLGGGSVTALPIIETKGGDVSAYIPTNVISITDGQIFLNSSMFRAGITPAVDIAVSVSRIGSSAQLEIIKELSGTLKIELALYREVEVFNTFKAEIDDITRDTLENGSKLMELIKQYNSHTKTTETEIVLLFLPRFEI